MKTFKYIKLANLLDKLGHYSAAGIIDNFIRKKAINFRIPCFVSECPGKTLSDNPSSGDLLADMGVACDYGCGWQLAACEKHVPAAQKLEEKHYTVCPEKSDKV